MIWTTARGLRYFRSIALWMGIGACFGLALAQEKAAKVTALPDGYRIGAGDVLQIGVWKEPDASLPEVMVRTDGKITVPLIGDVDVLGLSPEELRKNLVAKFSRFINDPVVTVSPRQINSRKIYVLGTVKNEGPIPLLRPMTVLQALDEAGGFGEWAAKKKIYVLRTVNGKQVKLPFDYQAIIKGKHMEQNVTLLPDDTIIVP